MGKIKNLIRGELLSRFVGVRPDPYVWVFSSTDNRHYNYNSRYLFEYVRDHVPEVTPLFVINDAGLREKLSSVYGEKYFIETETSAGMKKALGAGVWFTSAGLPVYGTGLLRRRMIVNLWHGVPLKKIALLDPNLGKLSRFYFKKIFSENYTCILTTSRSLIPLMAESFAVPENKIRVWGQPRNDGMFQAKDRRKLLREIYGELPEYRRTVLYAPTFRDYGEVRLFPFEDFDMERLEKFLEKEKMIIFVRTHIAEKAAAGPYLGERIRFLGEEQAEDVTGMLDIFDCLVTDYSSIYIDYLLTDHPMIFLPYDRQEYMAGRGMNFEYDEVTPGPKPRTMEEFLTCLVSDSDSWKAERARVNRLFNDIRKPCSADICGRILKKLILQRRMI